jgi:predicted small metal-binding protein
MSPEAKASERKGAKAIELVVLCDCGFEARGTPDELIPVVQKHGLDVHNMTATAEQVLEMARPA